jgi:hypothetical protein|nr:MAG TPA: hypothetical protein [Caudoviricetes sp.]
MKHKASTRDSYIAATKATASTNYPTSGADPAELSEENSK